MAATNPLVSLLGDKLVKGESSVATADALAGKKAIGLYFSAHWCPPCRQFTPMLASAYTKDLQGKGLEVVFVSSDKSEDEFKSYYATHPWLALPFENRDLKAALSKKYKVRGIPTFVILDGETGKTITVDGREAFSEDPTGKSFPWKPPTFWDALGTEFLRGTDGETADIDEIKGKGKIIGLYFSAHWCPPCRGFTPELIKAYTDHLKAKDLEIIFVSSDRDAASFQEYYETMPWLAIPNGDPRKGKLSKLFGVEGIPSFALVDGETGETINANARGLISADMPNLADFPFRPKPLLDLNGDPSGINDELALIALLEGCDAPTKSAAMAVMEQFATARKAANDETLFYTASAPGQIVSRVRDLTKLSDVSSTPQLLLLDIPDDGGFYVASGLSEVTAETVAGFMEQYKSKKLTRQQLG